MIDESTKLVEYPKNATQEVKTAIDFYNNHIEAQDVQLLQSELQQLQDIWDQINANNI